MSKIEIKKGSRVIEVEDEKQKNQYRRAQDERKKLRKEKHLGPHKLKKDRLKQGSRGNSIVTRPICELTDQEFNELVRRVKTYLPADKQLISENSRKWVQKATTVLGQELAEEILSPKPDAERIKSICDPMSIKRG